MEKAIFSMWHINEVYPNLSSQTFHAWLKSEVIKPPIPANGPGFPARYNENNLIETGIVRQANNCGIKNHQHLAKLMQSPTNAGRPLVEYLAAQNFEFFLILPGASAFNRELTEVEEAESPLFFLRSVDQLGEFFGAHLPTAGWTVIDVHHIRETVQQRLAAL